MTVAENSGPIASFVSDYGLRVHYAACHDENIEPNFRGEGRRCFV